MNDFFRYEFPERISTDYGLELRGVKLESYPGLCSASCSWSSGGSTADRKSFLLCLSVGAGEVQGRADT